MARSLSISRYLQALPIALIAVSASTALAGELPTPRSLEALSNQSGAPVSIVFFSDYACPYSSHLYFELKALEAKHPKQLRVLMRQMPLDIHPDSPLAHEAALAAAAQGKLAAMSDLLFANQKRLDRDSLLVYAAELQLDMSAFHEAIDSHRYRPIVEDDQLEAEALGIEATPTIFLNGHRLDGFQTLDVLEKQIGQQLAQAGVATAPIPAATTGTISPEQLAKLTQSGAEIRGSASAPVTIVEFSDFQCPFCRQTVKPLEDLLEQRPAEVRLVFRSYPLDFHQYSELAHEAALAAGAQGNFWQMHDLIFANQSRLERADLVRYAAQLNLDMPAFERALDTHAYAGAIAQDRALGAQIGVEGTPTIFINGKRLTGARSLVELEQLADEEARIAQGSPTVQEQVVPTPPAEDTHFTVLGSESAPVRLSWFNDVRSPLALRVAALLRSLNEAYPGQLRVDFKTMELANHADADLASRALLAAAGLTAGTLPGTKQEKSWAQEKFWAMYDALAASSTTLDPNALSQQAAAAGLDPDSILGALDSPPVTESIERDQAEEVRRAIVGSPSVFIGSVRIDGVQPERVYRQAIEAALAAHGIAQASAAAGR